MARALRGNRAREKDAGNGFLTTPDFADTVKKSDNYYIIINREEMSNLSYCIDDIYGLLLQIARTSIFDQEVISQFSQRIYAIVGIFMLFKVSVSLITYILNPDDFTDKEKGFTSIIKRIVISLAMIVLGDTYTIVQERNGWGRLREYPNAWILLSATEPITGPG